MRSRLEPLGVFLMAVGCVADLASNVYYSLFTKVEHPFTVDFPYTAPPLAAGALIVAWSRRSVGLAALGVLLAVAAIALR